MRPPPPHLRVVSGWSPSDFAERRMIRRYKQRRALLRFLRHQLVDVLILSALAFVVAALFTIVVFGADR